MRAYKGFTKELISRLGNGEKETCCFTPGETKEVEASKTVSSGFHCCENPFECLAYYAFDGSNRFFIVEAAGDIDEDDDEWSYDIETQWMYNYCDSRNFKNFRASSADVAFLRERFPKRSHSYYDDSTVFAVISKTEYEWAADRRENTEIRRCAKVQETMSRIPPLPEDVEKWFYDAALGEDFAIRTDAAGVYMCTACHGRTPLDAWRMPDGKPARNNDMVACPHCGSSIRLKKRRKDVFAYSDFITVQPIDDTMSVIKVCNGSILITGDRKDISVREKIRILSGRGENAVDRKNIYYQQYGGDFDNKSNPHNHRISSRQYMYPVGITEALSGTKAGMWSALFTDFAAAGLKLAYDTLITCFDPDVHALMEMLYRGRFYKLLAEESGRINDMEVYIGCLDIKGTDIESTFGLGDRQLINRLRDRNGGGLMLAWLQWSKRNSGRIRWHGLNAGFHLSWQ